MEHRGTSFCNSCVKVPVNPCSRQPTPSYERYESKCNFTVNSPSNKRKIDFSRDERVGNDAEASNPTEIVNNFLEFLESIPDYGQIHHLSNEQFKQKVDYLKRRHKVLLQDLEYSLATCDIAYVSKFSIPKCNERAKNRSEKDRNDLKLNGTKCYLEDSRTASPIVFSSSKYDGLLIEKNLLTNRYVLSKQRN